eukprot:scaffold693_cov291-Chaetoceros_neogracile.AAC.7
MNREHVRTETFRQFKSIGIPRRSNVASSLQSIGNEYFRAKNYPKARSTYLRALEIRKHILEETHPTIAATYSSLGCVNCQSGKYTEAIRYNCKAVEIEETRAGAQRLFTSVKNLYESWRGSQKG